MKRVLYLDIIRILACIMIIVMHAPIPETGINSYILATDSLLTAPGIGLFIMVSGALLLPVTMPTKDFLKRRLSKVVIPTFVWTLLYYVIAPWTDIVDRGTGIQSFLSMIFSAQFNPVLWFMYMLVGLYLLAPILSSWLIKVSQREVEFYLVLWGITMCYPILRSFLYVNESTTGILYYFGGYAGYFLLGYYLKRYVVYISTWTSILLFALPLGLAIIMKVRNISIDFYDLFWYLSILVAMMSVSWFLLIRQYCPKYKANFPLHRFIVFVSNCCFGIYLSHILVMRGVLWRWDVLKEMSGIFQILITTFLTFSGSLLLTWLISYLPGADYVIGFKKRK